MCTGTSETDCLRVGIFEQHTVGVFALDKNSIEKGALQTDG